MEQRGLKAFWEVSPLPALSPIEQMPKWPPKPKTPEKPACPFDCVEVQEEFELTPTKWYNCDCHLPNFFARPQNFPFIDQWN